MSTEARAQRIGTDEIAELDRLLLNATTETEHIELIREKIEENIFVFCEYMETMKPRARDFLRKIVDLRGSLSADDFTMLFVRVCIIHRGEPLQIDADMVRQAMVFLINQKSHSTAAFGLLKLTFENQISLTEFPRELLTDFQKKYESIIVNFFKSLFNVRPVVVESLPSSLFCFSGPVLKALREGGDSFYKGMPYQFLPHVVSIVSLTFSNDQQAFDSFLAEVKQGCHALYDTLI